MVFVCIICSAGRNQMSRRNLGPYKLYNLTIVVHISEGLLRATFYHSLDRKSSFVQNVPIYFEDLQVNQLCIGFFTNEAFQFFSPPHFTHLFSGLHGTSKLDKLDTASELFTRAASVFGSCFWVVCQSPIQRQSCFHRYPLVNVYITMENHHVIAGKIHYFYGHVQ